MSRKRKKARRCSAADVLAGRVDPDAAELVRLIHQVNPTERGLDAERTARQYATKAALQSLLIERFGDKVLVAPHGGPQTVSLRVPSLMRDAGHAILDTLSVDARAFCRRALDQAVAGTSRPPAAIQPVMPGPLAEGRAALAAYDFAAAEGAFRAAHAADPTDPAPVVALMELWIDTLAADDEALAFFAALGSLAELPELRSLAAVAAARSRRCAQAEALLVGRSGARAAEAWVLVTQEALRAADLSAARRALAAAHAAAPALSLAIWEDALAGLAARLRAPAEAALEAMAATEPLDRVEAAALRLQADHPDSAVAGRVLHQIDEDRRAAERATLLERARAAMDAEQPGAAVTWLRGAERLGASVDIELAVAEAAAAAQRRAGRLARLAERLRAPDDDALLAWLALQPDERARLDVPRPEIAWLIQLGAPASGPAAKQAVRATLALARAQALLTSAPSTALALVEPHRAVLAALPDAARLIALSGEAVHLTRTARHRALIDAADALCGAGQFADALERLGQLAGVDPELDERARAVRGRAEDGLRVRALEGALLTLADPCERRRLLAEIVALDPRQAPRLADADRVIAHVFRRQVHPNPRPTDARLDAPRCPDTPIWLTEAGVALVPDLLAGHLFLRWIEGDRLIRAVTWRIGGGGLLDFVVEPERLRALLDDGRVITFAPDGARILRVDPLHLEGPPRVGLLLDEHAWICGDQLEIHVIARRQQVVLGAPVDTLARIGAQMAVFDAQPRLCAADGRLIERLPATARGATAGPDGLVLIGDAEHALDDQGLRGGQATGGWQLRADLLWYGRLDWSLPVPAGSLLLRDHRAQQAAALLLDPAGICCAPLSADAPPRRRFMPLWTPTEAVQPWRLTVGDPLAERRFSLLLDASAALRTQSPEAWLASNRPRHGPWADAICHHALRQQDPVAAERVALAALSAWPTSGLAGLVVAEPAARAGRWAAVAHALNGRTPEEGLAQRFLRLLGFARLHAGAPSAALDAWRSAIAIAPTAELERLVAAVAPALEDGSVRAAPSVFSAFVRALRAADLARVAGDLAGVVEALDHPWAWHFNEVQTLARLGEALLALPEVDAWRRRWGLAGIIDRLSRPVDPALRIELPMAGATWSRARTEAVILRAREELARAQS